MTLFTVSCNHGDEWLDDVTPKGKGTSVLYSCLHDTPPATNELYITEYLCTCTACYTQEKRLNFLKCVTRKFDRKSGISSTG